MFGAAIGGMLGLARKRYDDPEYFNGTHSGSLRHGMDTSLARMRSMVPAIGAASSDGEPDILKGAFMPKRRGEFRRDFAQLRAPKHEWLLQFGGDCSFHFSLASALPVSAMGPWAINALSSELPPGSLCLNEAVAIERVGRAEADACDRCLAWLNDIYREGTGTTSLTCEYSALDHCIPLSVPLKFPIG